MVQLVGRERTRNSLQEVELAVQADMGGDSASIVISDAPPSSLAKEAQAPSPPPPGSSTMTLPSAANPGTVYIPAVAHAAESNAGSRAGDTPSPKEGGGSFAGNLCDGQEVSVCNIGYFACADSIHVQENQVIDIGTLLYNTQVAIAVKETLPIVYRTGSLGYCLRTSAWPTRYCLIRSFR